MRRQRIASVCASNLQRRSAHRRVIFSERTHSIVVLASTLFFSSLFTHTRNDLLHHAHSHTTTRRMTKITAAILAAGVGSTEAWGWISPTRNPTAPHGFAGDSKTLKEFGWSAHKHGKIGECKGDCDADYQCATGLKCFHRSRPGTVTGCMGRSVSSYDYCYRPVPTAYPTAFPTAYPTNPPSVAAHKDAKSLTTHGYNAHNLANVKKHGFGMCQGDCDSDAQCRGSMVCYQSHKSGNTITGCEGRTLAIHDYCYQPLKRSSPKRCQEWSCAEWCKFFDQAAEDAGVYAKNGCADDGADTCKCRN